MHDKKIEPVLTDYDITINSIHRENMFKGTIIVCIVYAIFAFILISAAYFSDNIRDLLFDRFLPFTLIYIIGTIIIILIFIYYIVSFVPKKIDKNKLDDSISCPDYWKLEILDDDVIENSFDTTNYNKKLFKYRCVMDENVFNKATIYKQDKNTNISNLYRLGNKPAFITEKNGVANTIPYDDTYRSDNSAGLSKFLANKNDGDDKFYYLYKDVNAYSLSNLIYTNNANISSNIVKDLRESALIMNNYKKNNGTSLSSYDDLTSINPTVEFGSRDASGSMPSVNAVSTSNYLNAPNILTWASLNSTTTGNDIAPIILNGSTGAVTTNNMGYYRSTVYDWSTMNIETFNKNFGSDDNKYVYIIDTTITTAGTTNFYLVGKINKGKNNKLYYVSESYPTSVAAAPSIFLNKLANLNNYYFNDTYITNIELTTNTNYITVTALPNPNMKGPSIRLYNITERLARINNDNLSKERIPLSCSSVYPSFLASKEDEYSENNTLRCAYSTICKIPWSDLHCNDIEITRSA
jgi:hypothetical protein